MKPPISSRISSFFWGKIRKIFNSHTSFIVSELEDALIKCRWNLSKVDKIRLKYSKSYFFAMRVFDVSSHGSKINSTCVMKELQISRNSNYYIFDLPSISSKYILELGYRKQNGDWRELSSFELNLTHHIPKLNNLLIDQDWFKNESASIQTPQDIYDKSYQLSLSSMLGGSENLHKGLSPSGEG